VERAPTGKARGEIQDTLEYRSASGATPGLEAERAVLREQVPGAVIWYVQQYRGAVRWVAWLEADSPRHLLEGLRDAGKDAETVL
jgi:hypothetical protein